MNGKKIKILLILFFIYFNMLKADSIVYIKNLKVRCSGILEKKINGKNDY